MNSCFFFFSGGTLMILISIESNLLNRVLERKSVNENWVNIISLDNLRWKKNNVFYLNHVTQTIRSFSCNLFNYRFYFRFSILSLFFLLFFPFFFFFCHDSFIPNNDVTRKRLTTTYTLYSYILRLFWGFPTLVEGCLSIHSTRIPRSNSGRSTYVLKNNCLTRNRIFL